MHNYTSVYFPRFELGRVDLCDSDSRYASLRKGLVVASIDGSTCGASSAVSGLRDRNILSCIELYIIEQGRES